MIPIDDNTHAILKREAAGLAALLESDTATREQAIQLVEAMMLALGANEPLDTKFNNPCIIKAAHDEPLFVVRAQDITAAAMPMLWLANQRHMIGSNFTVTFQRKVESVFNNTRAIYQWQKEHKTKLAD